MKKLVALTMAAALVIAMAGCGSKTGVTSSETKTETEAGNATGKVYKVATDTTFAPFEFENEKGEMVGIDLDLLKEIAEDQGFTYEIQVLGFSAAVAALEAGECDAVIAGMSIKPDREVKYDFSNPYFQSGVGMAVAADSDIKTYDDLKGKVVAAKIGTDGCVFAESIAEQYGFTVTQFEDSSSMYQDVLTGNTVACFEDYPVLGYEISRGIGLSLPLPMEAGSKYGFATLKGKNPELVEMFNKGLKNLEANGRYDEIVNTYIAK